jgi:sugar-specific transcriptional regulator TrmB
MDTKSLKKELRELRKIIKKFGSPELLSANEINEFDSIQTRIRELMNELVNDKKITILVSYNKRERLKRISAAADKTLNAFLLTSAFKKRPPLDSDSAKFLTDIRQELRAVGNNLNQIATATNASRRSNSQAPNEIFITETLKDVRELIEKINGEI